MISQAHISKLLTEHILNAGTQWSVGTFGGIAEFSRDPGEPVELTTSELEIAAVTERGGIAIRLIEGLHPFASESMTKLSWSHRVALCLPRSECEMSRRAVLTELGPDTGALRIEDRGNVLFDLGLDTLQTDLCIRFADEAIVAQLRQHVGRSLFEPGNPAMGIILSASPHRVFISRAGRVEVYQTIPPAMGKSPDGPHTHILPKLLKSRRTHPATEPIPDGWIPCAHLYPPHPIRDGAGEPRPFDATDHDSFQRITKTFGGAENQAIKQRIMEAVNAGELPSATAQTRQGRTSIRIALRQMKAAGHASVVLPAWLAYFDQVDLEDDEDEAALHHVG
jgi:hypothetical protein